MNISSISCIFCICLSHNSILVTYIKFSLWNYVVQRFVTDPTTYILLHCSPEDGNRSSFRNAVFLSEFKTTDKLRNLEILSNVGFYKTLDSEEFHIVGYNAMKSVEIQSTIRRKMSPSSSESKSEPSKNPVWSKLQLNFNGPHGVIFQKIELWNHRCESLKSYSRVWLFKPYFNSALKPFLKSVSVHAWGLFNIVGRMSPCGSVCGVWQQLYHRCTGSWDLKVNTRDLLLDNGIVSVYRSTDSQIMGTNKEPLFLS
jgi:hypothetical protein